MITQIVRNRLVEARKVSDTDPRKLNPISDLTSYKHAVLDLYAIDVALDAANRIRVEGNISFPKWVRVSLLSYIAMPSVSVRVAAGVYKKCIYRGYVLSAANGVGYDGSMQLYIPGIEWDEDNDQPTVAGIGAATFVTEQIGFYPLNELYTFPKPLKLLRPDSNLTVRCDVIVPGAFETLGAGSQGSLDVFFHLYYTTQR